MGKTRSIAGIVLTVALLLGACGGNTNKNGNQNGTTQTDNQTTNTETATDTNGNNTATENGTATSTGNDSAAMKQKLDEIDYAEFDLSVDYGKDQEYEIEIDQENGMVEAKVEDELNNQLLHGQEAFDDIYPKLQQLTITKDTKLEDAIQQVLTTFNLKDNYKEFDLEIKFHDNTKIDFEDKK
ncbi:YusW family protein [Sporosarcina sp. Te-1]|uniref:YusW family protein n=1 Tax=Sporosarcina sp. Te-1 TaxID=2818390 RepID=UPI001A9D08D3|nr:YusW family protein [Sporosarcina sp. Te-1]QTD40916.1 YusW family protein [Sporosarcina sp. Te-1]